MSFSSAPWSSGRACRNSPFPRRSLEIGAIVIGFIYAWPLAAAYVVWKLMGYPALNEMKSFAERSFRNGFSGFSGFSAARHDSGNWAFEEYRRKEIERLEEERRRLEDESRAFTEFVDELKRARDREQFDAFMARRRAGSNY
ncbi:DUF2852 domain-containing protein [Methylobacterium frigidaeris]|uniref:DUF2852 domain-containing protein n=1 Tax=Methylobacterium frigidaeris TaxID=2038277 RepID=A0AA37M220_9HYPH|nr:DUF2852 domain-containing protein [Methylobacterium frigidaeris]PIK72051.1 hypothetical protein CS379_16080 [Methylobacterium frigidaeris]GJD59977.1 hypothetical protein MPEAHAMD_0108 [Methylobacterium frigidaeris]